MKLITGEGFIIGYKSIIHQRHRSFKRVWFVVHHIVPDLINQLLVGERCNHTQVHYAVGTVGTTI